MNLGVLAFSCDGLYLGVAYRDQELKSGPIYPAVAMLHKAGFTVRTGIPFPSIFNDIYK
jgi:E3 ubiquitin-protein ligase NRDP1